MNKDDKDYLILLSEVLSHAAKVEVEHGYIKLSKELAEEISTKLNNIASFPTTK